MKRNGKKRQTVDQTMSPYPFPFPKDILKHFVKPGQTPVWEFYAEDWTPEWDVPLCVKCLIEWENMARFFGAGLKKAHDVARDYTDLRAKLRDLIVAHEKLFDQLREIIMLDRKVFAIDPVIRREVLNPQPPAPKLLPEKPEKLVQYPFPVPLSVRKHLAKCKPPAMARGIDDEDIADWTPDANIPLHFVKLSLWEAVIRGVIHMADERIVKLKPSSEHYQDLTTFIALTDNLLDTLLHIVNEAHETFAYDPVVQRQVRQATTAQPTA